MLTDVHVPEQCAPVAEAVDVLQIPAFLCRQTDLLVAAAKTGRAVNIKKGQFLAPWDMKNVAKKLAAAGNDNILLCERGVCFGYNTLVSDMRALPIMAETGYPVVFDATHSVQQPGGQGTATGGERRFVPVLARAACAIGVAAVFMETHQDPDHAPSDGPNMVRLQDMPALLATLCIRPLMAKIATSCPGRTPLLRELAMTAIVDIIAREILDSRGNPTVEVDVMLESGAVRAAPPCRRAPRPARTRRSSCATATRAAMAARAC